MSTENFELIKILDNFWANELDEPVDPDDSNEKFYFKVDYGYNSEKPANEVLYFLRLPENREEKIAFMSSCGYSVSKLVTNPENILESVIVGKQGSNGYLPCGSDYASEEEDEEKDWNHIYYEEEKELHFINLAYDTETDIHWENDPQ